jgi:hypothetical protein
VLEYKVIFGHTRNIARYLGADGLGVSVERKIIVIGPDHDLVFRSQQQVSPMSERPDDGQKFPVIDIVVALRWIQGLRVVSHRLEFPPIVSLIQNCSQRVLRGVYF